MYIDEQKMKKTGNIETWNMNAQFPKNVIPFQN